MSTSPRGSAVPSGLDLTLDLDASRPCDGDVLVVAVHVVGSEDAAVVVDRASVELVRTVTYAYRRGDSSGSATTAIDQVVTVVDASPLYGVSGFAPGEVLERAVKLTVPADGPGTADGTIIQVRWTVRARFVVPGRHDAVIERALTVRSRARHCEADAATPPVEAARRGLEMSFDELSTRTLLPGIPLTGTLHIAATRLVPARIVRIELVLRESVEHGPDANEDPARSPADDGKDASTVIARTVVACRPFAPGQLLDVPFSLEVPHPLPAPSLRIPGFRISWELRGVVDLPLALDPRLTLGLVGATTAPW